MVKNKEMKELILTALRQEPEIITEDVNIDDKECKENKRYIIYSNKKYDLKEVKPHAYC